MQARPVIVLLKVGVILSTDRQQYSIIVFLFREGKENKVVMSPFSTCDLSATRRKSPGRVWGARRPELLLKIAISSTVKPFPRSINLM